MRKRSGTISGVLPGIKFHDPLAGRFILIESPDRIWRRSRHPHSGGASVTRRRQPSTFAPGHLWFNAVCQPLAPRYDAECLKVAKANSGGRWMFACTDQN